MTDTVAFYRTIVSNVTQFVNAYENLRLVQDRIEADSALSTATAAAASSGGRTDLTSANFDNLKLAMEQLAIFMNTANAQVPNGGELKLTFYQII